jgi:hypothetical protein
MVGLMTCAMLMQAPPRRPPQAPPPPGGPDAVGKRISEMHPPGKMEQELLALARVYLYRSGQRGTEDGFPSNRDLAAADALSRAVEHQQHIGAGAGPPPPPMEEIGRHLERVYFRLQQADYFVKESGDPSAKRIAAGAREYYQRAVRARDEPDRRTADECAKSADECMRALESLAQAGATGRPRAPAGAPPRPWRRP